MKKKIFLVLVFLISLISSNCSSNENITGGENGGDTTGGVDSGDASVVADDRIDPKYAGTWLADSSSRIITINDDGSINVTGMVQFPSDYKIKKLDGYGISGFYSNIYVITGTKDQKQEACNIMLIIIFYHSKYGKMYQEFTYDYADYYSYDLTKK